MNYMEDDSPLVRHAYEELKRAGIFNKDMDYGELVPKAVLELVATFARQGHSGMSASIVLAYFDKLIRRETLTPLTSDPCEWIDQSECSGYPIWQNRRDPACMSYDGGKTYWHVDFPNIAKRSALPSSLTVSE